MLRVTYTDIDQYSDEGFVSEHTAITSILDAEPGLTHCDAMLLCALKIAVASNLCYTGRFHTKVVPSE